MTGRTLSEDCRLHGLMMPMPDDGQCWYCARDAAPGSPWIPLDPDGLPPATYPSWRAQEQARKERA